MVLPLPTPRHTSTPLHSDKTRYSNRVARWN